MATNVLMQLADSRGSGRILVFTGLSHPVVVHPVVLGEPLLTAQAFYYLEQLESVAHVRYATGEQILTDEEMEYLIDNYLYEYSKVNPNSRISCKIVQPRFWVDAADDMYARADDRSTEVLTLDQQSDPTVEWVRSLTPQDPVDLNDWAIGRNYANIALRAYLDAMCSTLQTKVMAFVQPTERRDGYMGKLRVIESGEGLLDFFQVEALENVSFDRIPPSGDSFDLPSSPAEEALTSLPIERITATRLHTPVLLSHYFAGLKELDPSKAFVGFYNVLEYYFEEAPILLSTTSATNERKQLECVVDLLTTEGDLRAFLSTLDHGLIAALGSALVTSSGVAIQPLASNPLTSTRADLARWLYEIRCAIVHSKKTRYGQRPSAFEPYTASAKLVGVALPLVRWLAVLCIEKDHSLRTGTP